MHIFPFTQLHWKEYIYLSQLEKTTMPSTWKQLVFVYVQAADSTSLISSFDSINIPQGFSPKEQPVVIFLRIGARISGVKKQPSSSWVAV